METEEILKEEYFTIQGQIESYDEKALTIKAWSVTVSIAGLGAGFYENAADLFWLSGASAGLFWGIEVYWKLFQRAFYDRALEIEDYFSAPKGTLAPLQISRSWQRSFRSLIVKKESYYLIFYPHVMLPHSIVFFGGLLIYYFCR